MINNKKILKLISFVLIIFSICTFFYLTQVLLENGYNQLYILPFSFLICFLLFLKPVFLNRQSIFVNVFIASIFARYVILPFLMTLTNYYYYSRSINPPNSESIRKAIFLMSYELFIVSIALLFIFYFFSDNHTKRKERYNLVTDKITYKEHNPKFIFATNNIGYFGFFMLTTILIILFPSTLLNFNFLSTDESLVSSFSEGGLLYSIVVYCIMTLKNLLFVSLIYIFGKIYNNRRNYFWVLMSLILVFLNTSIFYGISRIDIIITAITSMIIFNGVFKMKKKFIPIIIMSLIVIGIFQSVTIARGIVGVKESTSVFWDITDKLSVYLGGPYNVAMAIETAEIFPESRHLSVFLFDIFRPMIGINVFVKDLPLFYSNIYFNERIFYGIRVTQIIPMIGQGYLFFGFFGAPIISILFIWIAKKFTEITLKLENIRIEILYIITLSCIRLGFMLGQNTMNQVNDMSMNLFLFLIVYWINNNLVFKKLK
ncbi:O-antigen polymerase [Anaeromicrobium sediminis]|uniref:Oligosaccharide repeat unit polymerase n=1 Tax=Anaeromicrobium sediminis TaxID=1478221 RepID=A0A267MIZ7_9FIRM|nr:O-antigen polymerase [Anaeromicrobium sediminis]PAB59392.1 hypothetical protein CCE28_11070 [Anaeromicrobium sediminis]